jgi:MYXO-CTERM domain-containing protein
MSMGMMRTIFHITGDEEIGRFYYEEMVGRRDYMTSIEGAISVIYFNEQTNYSNVNMAFVAAYGVLRYETDGIIAPRIRTILQDHLWSPGRNREAAGLGQAFFDVLYAGFQSGDRALGTTAVAQGVANLAEFPDPPYWNPLVTNCDDAEIAAGRCTAIDGTTMIELAGEPGRGDSVVAVEPLPKRLRPPSNFEWRSDPHDVNGGGGGRLNPGGGFHAAYWMGRFLENGSTGFDNVSSTARAPLPWTPAAPDAGPPRDGGPDAAGDAGDAGVVPPGDGCGCRAAPVTSSAPSALLIFAFAFFVARRRR